MESKLWLCSTDQYARVRKACEDKSEIDIFGQKYVVTSWQWDLARGGYYTVMPLIPIQPPKLTPETDRDWRSALHDWANQGPREGE